MDYENEAIWRPASPRRIFMAAVGLGLLFACGPTLTNPLARLATPENHTTTGMKLLRQERVAAAEREFQLALRHEPNMVEAAVGMGLVKAYRNDFSGAWDLLKRAGAAAAADHERISVTLGSLQTRALEYLDCRRRGLACLDEEWLAEAESLFAKAEKIVPSSPAASYWLGECYLAAGRWEKAGRMYTMVLDAGMDYLQEARSRWRVVQKLRVVRPSSAVARVVALERRLSRAKAAALLADEAKIMELLGRNRGAGQKVRGLTPRATDVEGHDLQREVEKVIALNLKGLTVAEDGRFRPDEPLERAGLAQVLEEVLVRATGDGSLAVRFKGKQSPFFDVQPDAPYFNAVLLAASRGLMEQRQSGEFAPLTPVDGAEAIWAMEKLKEELRR